jgi:hypothetical protein
LRNAQINGVNSVVYLALPYPLPQTRNLEQRRYFDVAARKNRIGTLSAGFEQAKANRQKSHSCCNARDALLRPMKKQRMKKQ